MPNRWLWSWASWGPGLERDLVAGLTLAAIAAPEQMATARLAGLGPQIGMIAFVAGSLGFAAFGASRLISVGADSTIAPIFAGSLAASAVAGSHHYAELAAALALMVGALLIVAGRFRLGWIADLLSQPVTTGFLAGVAVHIVLSQAPAALGLPEEAGDVYQRLAALAGHLGEVDLAAAAVAFGVFAVILAAERLSPRVPGALMALALATAASAWLELDRHGVAVLGALPFAAPRLSPPDLGFEQLVGLVGLAVVIALVVMVQTAATARSFDERGEPDVGQDFVGVGAGCLLAGLVGAFPVNASPPRTAAAVAAGGRSKASGLVAAAAVLLLATLGGGLMAQTPAAALAGVLLYIASRIFRLRAFAHLLRRTPAEFGLAVITALLMVVLPIETGATIGIFLSLGHGVFTITRARLLPFEPVAGTTVWWPMARGDARPRPGPALVMGFQAPLSFLNAHDFRRGVTDAVADAAGASRLFVLEASSIVEVDFTAAGVLTQVIGEVRSSGLDFAVARLESVRAQAALERFGVIEALGADHLFRSVAEAITALAPTPNPASGNDGPAGHPPSPQAARDWDAP